MDSREERLMKRYIAALAFGVVIFSTPALSNTVKNMVAAEARRQGVPVGLAVAVAKAESNFKCSAVGEEDFQPANSIFSGSSGAVACCPSIWSSRDRQPDAQIAF